MKKSGLKLLFLFTLILASQIVSAQTVGEVFITTLGEQMAGVLEKVQATPDNLSTVLLGALLFIILYSIIKQVFNFEGKLAWLSSGAVSLIIVVLTFLYLPENFVEAITLQYSAIGITILAIIPFLILLYFTTVVSNSLFIARTIWIFYVVYYFILFAFRLSETPFESWSQWFTSNLPFFGAIIAGILVLIYIGWVRKKVFEEKLSANYEQASRDVNFRATGRKVEREDAASRLGG